METPAHTPPPLHRVRSRTPSDPRALPAQPCCLLPGMLHQTPRPETELLADCPSWATPAGGSAATSWVQARWLGESVSLVKFGCPSLAGDVGLPTLPLKLQSPPNPPRWHWKAGQRRDPFVASPRSLGIPKQLPGPASRRAGRVKGVQGEGTGYGLAGRAGRGGTSISAEDRVIGSGDNESQGSGAQALPLPPHTLVGWFPKRAWWPTSVTSAVTQSRPLVRGRGARPGPLAALMQPVLS